MTSLETVQLVEIRQPFCSRSFGSAPCMATGSGDQKCYNTRGTCKDAANFELGTPLSLFFSRGHVAEREIVPNALPFLRGVSTAPTRINLAVADRNAKGLGQRAKCTIRFADSEHTDRIVDPYLSDRSWNPLDGTRGTFWARWLARNKYRQNIEIVIYEGYRGQTLAEMKTRRYFWVDDSRDVSGGLTVVGKDILSQIEEQKAQCPAASPGLLYTDIDAVQTSFEVANALEADYPATGTLRINDEIMTYSGRAASENGIEFTGVVRGTDNSTAEDHEVDDGVQECVRFEAVPVADLLETLLNVWGTISSSWLDTAAWQAEANRYLSFYRLTALITEPTAVAKLVAEIQEQALCFLWWDERLSLVKMKAVRGIEAEPPTISDSTGIIAGSVSYKRKPKERASQVWVYYRQGDFTEDEKKVKAYKSQFVLADLGSEAADRYGEAAIRKIWGRWLPSDALAQNTATKILTRYVDIPSEIRFRLDAKDRDYWVGDTVKIDHSADVDEFGARNIRNWTIVSAEEKRPGELIEYEAVDTTLYGKIYFILPEGAPDYTPGTETRGFYIGDADGLLSDGTPCARIS